MLIDWLNLINRQKKTSFEAIKCFRKNVYLGKNILEVNGMFMSVIKKLHKRASSARLRYTQMSGRLGGLLTEILIGKGWIKRSHENENVCYITDKGKKIFTEEEAHPVQG